MPSPASSTPCAEPARLALYYYERCPYCVRVLDELRLHDREVELRHVLREPAYRQELFAVRGRGTVPVLRIECPEGEVRWLPESRDIVAYLRTLRAAAEPSPPSGLLAHLGWQVRALARRG